MPGKAGRGAPPRGIGGGTSGKTSTSKPATPAPGIKKTKGDGLGGKKSKGGKY